MSTFVNIKDLLRSTRLTLLLQSPHFQHAFVSAGSTCEAKKALLFGDFDDQSADVRSEAPLIYGFLGFTMVHPNQVFRCPYTPCLEYLNISLYHWDGFRGECR